MKIDRRLNLVLEICLIVWGLLILVAPSQAQPQSPPQTWCNSAPHILDIIALTNDGDVGEGQPNEHAALIKRIEDQDQKCFGTIRSSQ